MTWLRRAEWLMFAVLLGISSLADQSDAQRPPRPRQVASAAQPSPVPEPTVSFREEIAPVLIEQCYDCHQAGLAEGGFRVDTFEQLLAESDSGHALLAGEPARSELIERLVTEDLTRRMPLDGEPLDEATVAVFREWVAAGLPFDGFDPTADIGLLLPPPTYPTPPSEYPQPLPITGLAFAPGNDELWIGGYHEVLIWDWQAGTLRRRLPQAPQRVHAIHFSPNGQQVFVAGGTPGRRGEVRRFDRESGELLSIPYAGRDEVLAIDLHPVQPWLAIAGTDRLVTVVDYALNRPQWQAASHSDWVSDVRWDRAGQRLLTASRDQSSKVFAGDSGELLASYAGHNAAVTGGLFVRSAPTVSPAETKSGQVDAKNKSAAAAEAALAPPETEVISLDADGFAHRWNIGSLEKQQQTRLGSRLLLPPVQIDQRWASGGDQQRLFVMTAALDQRWHVFPEVNTRLTGLAVDPTGNWLAAGLETGEVVVWQLDTRQQIKRWQALPLSAPQKKPSE